MIYNRENIIINCKQLISAYNLGVLGYMKMPEDSHPDFLENNKEIKLVYFTLPMALNYQRNSYKLWEAALSTFNDKNTKNIFSIENSAILSHEKLKEYLLKYKLALQPNKHINTWKTISQTIFNNWGNISTLLKSTDYDFLKLRDTIQNKFKKGFPYLSGPKIFNYWSYIIQRYGDIKLKNSEFIEIAPDTHITKCSVVLGVISEQESKILSKEEISKRWRELLKGTNINPIDMHSPLWFWSKNNFKFKLK